MSAVHEMSEPNPYQPPQEPDPLAARQAVKGGVALIVIILLTPVATFIAFFTSCTAAIFWDIGNNSSVVWTVLLGPPALVFAGMTYWAIRVHLRQRSRRA